MAKTKEIKKGISLSSRADRMPYSPIRKLSAFADEAKKKGIKVYHLNIGQPDIETPVEIFESIANYREKVLGYGPSGGILELRLAVLDYYRNLGFDLDLDNIWITIGGSEAIIFAMMSVCDPNDEIIVFEPYYTNYNGFAVMSNIKLVAIETKIENGFHLPPESEIKKKITSRTRAILINTPEEEMFILQRLCKKYNLYILSDEVYREFIYDGKEHISALSLPEIEDRVILMDSISKRFSACGARVGCIISRNKKVMDALIRFCQARLCPPTLEQIGAIAAYRHIDKYITPMIKEYEHRRNVLFDCLKEIPEVYGHKPEGAFYTVLSLPVKDADRFCHWLLTDFSYENSTVMLAPANGFYSTLKKGRDQIRIAYVLKEEDIRKAVKALDIALKKYKD
jgi:aspartate aminotransferase